jgi:hypothetical protein
MRVLLGLRLKRSEAKPTGALNGTHHQSRSPDANREDELGTESDSVQDHEGHSRAGNDCDGCLFPLDAGCRMAAPAKHEAK